MDNNVLSVPFTFYSELIFTNLVKANLKNSRERYELYKAPHPLVHPKRHWKAEEQVQTLN